MTLFSPERLRVISVMIPLLQETPSWPDRWEVETYVHRCIDAGFADTDDKIRACVERYKAGKRKVTPPGSKRRQREAKRRAAELANVPQALLDAIAAALAAQPKAVEQYKAGVEKALNALVGLTLKRYKADPAVVRELLVNELAGK